MRWRFAGTLVALMLVASGCGGKAAVTPKTPGPSQAPVPSQAGGGPWAGRGWVEDGMTTEGMTYKNSKHGLRLVAPPMWLIEREDKFDAKFLWSMKKLENIETGNLRAVVAVIAGSAGGSTAEQFFNSELAGFQQPSAGIQVQASGPANAPEMYEMQFVNTSSGLRGRNVYFVRNGTGYIVTLGWAANATPADLAELDSVRRVMSLPEARTASPPGPSPGAPRLGAIVFAGGVSSENKPVDPSSRFPAGINKVYAVFDVIDLKADDAITGVWYRGTEKIYEVQKRTAAQIFGHAVQHGSMYEWVSFDRGFKLGSYRVEMSINGTVAQTGTFEVK